MLPFPLPKIYEIYLHPYFKFETNSLLKTMFRLDCLSVELFD